MKVYLGIDIGGTNVKIAVVGGTGKIHARGLVETLPNDKPLKTFRRIRLACDSLVNFRKNVEIAAAGIGCAGLVDPVRGRLHRSPNLPAWENAPLGRIAGRALGVYTVLDNDANTAAYGEYRLGGSRRVGDLVFITLGTGVGGGVVSGGRLLRGAANYAAELGHTTINFEGPKCRCGNRGCLEAYVGSYGLLRAARARLERQGGRWLRLWVVEQKKRLTPQLLFEAARRRDRVATAVIRQAGDRLGVGLASMINVFNPERVVVGGGVAGSFDLLRPYVETAVRRCAFRESAEMAEISVSDLGNDASVAGAALLAVEALENDRAGGRNTRFFSRPR